MRSIEDTIAAIATPLGEGGLGVIRVSGPQALEVGDGVFRFQGSLSLGDVPSHTCHFGRFEEEGSVVERGVATVFRAPRSYTGQDTVEFSTHGGVAVLRKVLSLLFSAGARLAEPGEYTLRAFLNGKMDLAQAEAVADVIRARTDAARCAAVQQLEGHLSRKIRDLRERVLSLLAHIEVGLDHSDEDHPFLSPTELAARCGAIQEELQVLLASSRSGRLIREGFRAALVGKPNVGKSSLLNALLREDRAIVTPIPGTTRDTLEEAVDLQGIPMILVDTAGVRSHTIDVVERMGMERTRQAIAQADVLLCVLDSSRPLENEDRMLFKEVAAKPHVWVLNKADLVVNHAEPVEPQACLPDRQAQDELNGGAPAVSVSAKTGAGLLRLEEALLEVVLQGRASFGEELWVTNVRHAEALRRAQEALSSAREAARQRAYEECVAMELKSALDALGEIIGETVTEDLLAKIFSNFCVGK